MATRAEIVADLATQLRTAARTDLVIGDIIAAIQDATPSEQTALLSRVRSGDSAQAGSLVMQLLETRIGVLATALAEAYVNPQGLIQYEAFQRTPRGQSTR